MDGFERVQYIMDKEGLNKNSLSTAIGMNNNVTITRIINEKRNPSRTTCQKIIDRFPKYSLDWLFYGKGEIRSSITNIKENAFIEKTPNEGNATNITNRLQIIVDKVFNGNKASFAKRIGIAPTSVSNYLSKERASKPSSDLLEKIINLVDCINPRWLLTGKGEMLNTPQKENFGANNVSGNNSANILNDAENEHLRQIITEKDIIIAGQERLIAEKERLISVLMK